MLLLPPAASSGAGSNPYLTLGGLTGVSDVLATAMANDATAAALTREGVTGTYTVVRDLTTNGPVLQVGTAGADAAATTASLRLVVAALGPTLAQLQSSVKVPAKYRISTLNLTFDRTARPVGKSQLRATLVAVGVGALGTVLGASLVDGYLRRRARRTAVAGEPVQIAELVDPGPRAGLPDSRARPPVPARAGTRGPGPLRAPAPPLVGASRSRFDGLPSLQRSESRSGGLDH